MTITINLPDQQAAALQAKASEQGLTLEAWFRQLADAASPATPRRYTLAELVAQCDPDAPASAEEQAWLDAPPVGREAL